MRFTKTCAAMLMAVGLLAVAAPARAALISWDVDPTQSFVRLAIPDQAVSFDGTNATVRIRNSQNTSAWSDAGGRRAFLDGTIASNLNDGNSISFLGGQSALVGLESGSFRPNPASFNPADTDGDNPDGQYTNTTGAAAAFAATVRATVVITVDLAKIAFRSVEFDVNSGSLALDGGGNFAGGSDFGIATAVLDVDGLDAFLVGQLIPDILSAPVAGLMGINTSGGTVTDLGGNLRMLLLNITVPISIDFEGVPLSASAAGQIVAFAIVPEPSSVLLAGFAAFGLCWAGRRRFRRR